MTPTRKSWRTLYFRINFLKKGIGLWKKGLVEKIVNFFFHIILPPYLFRENYRFFKKEKE